MTKHWTVLVTASLATLLALFAPAPVARADIFQWEYINPTNPSQGKQPSTMLCPDGAGVNAVPGANLLYRNLTMAYLIGANLSGATASVANLTNAELSWANLTNANLIGADLTGAYGDAVTLTNADLSLANLTNANIAAYVDENGGHYYSDLSAANLTEANLTNANFALATLSGANFSHANLTNVRLDDAVLTGANLTGAEVRGTNFTRYGLGSGITTAQLHSTASYQAHDLTGIVLAGNNLTGVNLAGQNLTNASLYNVFAVALNTTNLTGANLSQSKLTNADFSNVTLTGADLTGADVRGAKFFNSPISSAQLYSTASYQAFDLHGFKLSGNHAGLNLAGQYLANADFHGAKLANSNLSQANLTGADFSNHYDPYYSSYGTDLTGANLSQANLTNASFSGYSYSVYDEILGEVIIVVSGANLTSANLSGADARGANFQYATLTGANTSNLIQSNGHIAGLDLTSGASLFVRNGIPIVVDQHLAMDAISTLRLEFDAGPWYSLISFASGIPVALGGTMELAFAPGVDVAAQSGRTIDLFNWTGVNPTGAFTVSSPYSWDLTKLYTTGEITLLATSDFNGDNQVDGADLAAWSSGFGLPAGAAHSQGDADFDHDVDGADFLAWQRQFTSAPPTAPANAAVPEPTTAWWVIAGGLALHAANRRATGDRGSGRAAR